jgi:hypothetical protein
MKKIGMASLALAIVFSVSIAFAEMEKEGSGVYRSAKSSKNDVLAMGKDYMQVNYNQLGMVVDAPENSPFENATFNALGTYYQVKDEYEGSYFVEWVCPNGDKIYGKSNFNGIMGKENHNVVELIGGTGACEGIQGTVELDRGPQVKSAQENIRQSFSVGKVSWKIP